MIIKPFVNLIHQERRFSVVALISGALLTGFANENEEFSGR